MRSIRRYAMLLGVAVLCLPAVAGAVAWQNLQFQQLSTEFADPTANALFSSTGRCLVEYGKDLDDGFLNVVAEVPGLGLRAWAVRNLALMDLTLGPPVETVGYRFPLDELGVESGTPVEMILYAALVTAEPMNDEDGFLFAATTEPDQAAFVEQAVYQVRDGVPGAPVGQKEGEMYASERVPFTGSSNHSVTAWMGCNMPNVPLNSGTDPMDDCACAPASCANSLAWLDQQHDEFNIGADQRALLKQLSNLMNREAGKGASNATMARAKLDFIEAHNLPIHVKLQSWGDHGDISSSSGHTTATDAGGDAKDWPTQDWLKSEAQRGEDVELLVSYLYKDATGWHADGGHAVVLSGLGTMMTDWVWVAWKHDERQSDGTGTIQEAGILHDTGDGIIVVGMGYEKTLADGTKVKVEAYLDGVLSESYDPSHQQPPAQEDFDSYCDYITRTIKPGGSLDLNFPTDDDRSMDVTVYYLDRSHNPPTQRAGWRWTKNSGRTRGLTNPTDVCITVKIHNDDMDGQYWFWYDDYTVGLTQTKSPVSPDPSNFEETGGFSLGGNDGYCEFGPAALPSMVVDYTPQIDLTLVPGTLGEPGQTAELFLNCSIPVWNKHWSRLGLIVDVLEVMQPGDLFVECASNGFAEAVPIVAPGRYQVILGEIPEGLPDFSLRLEAQVGLQIRFDAIGVPTLVAPYSAVGDEVPAPTLYLAANQPNPFNPLTEIRFGLESGGWARLAVYDLQGRRIALLHEGVLDAGPHRRTWNGRDAGDREVAAGVYLYRLETERGRIARKMTLVR